MNIILDRFRLEREYGQVKKSYEDVRLRKRRYPFLITGLCEGALDAFLASFTLDENRGTALIVAQDDSAANRLRIFLSNCGLSVGFYPSRRPVLYNIVSSHELEHERLACLAGIVSGGLDVVVTVPEAALQYTAPMEKITAGAKTVAVGDMLSLGEFTKFLVSMGYVPCDLVDGRGQFSTRGGILDVFPPQLPAPVRMELFGDEVDSIGYFDIMTQRKTENIESFSVMCAREVMPEADVKKSLSAHIAEMAAKAKNAEARAALMHEKECLDADIDAPFIDKYISYIYKEPVCLLDYFGEEMPLVFAIERATIEERLRGYEIQSAEDVRELLENALISPKYKDFAFTSARLFSFFENNAALVLDNFTSQYPGKLTEIFSFVTRKPPLFTEGFEQLKDDIAGFVKANYAVLIVCENSVSASNLQAMLEETGLRTVFIAEYGNVDEVPRRLPVITCGAIPSFEILHSQFVCISELAGSSMRIAKRAKKRASSTPQSSKQKLLSYADLTVGDLVVHDAHGIGRYVGIENIKNYDGTRRDHIKIQYSGTDVLYVPCEQIDLVAKYIGPRSDDAGMKLSKLGGSDWHKTKARVKKEVR